MVFRLGDRIKSDYLFPYVRAFQIQNGKNAF